MSRRLWPLDAGEFIVREAPTYKVFYNAYVIYRCGHRAPREGFYGHLGAWEWAKVEATRRCADCVKDDL